MINIEQIAPNAHRIVIMEEFRQADAQKIVEFARQQNEGGEGGNLLLDLTAMVTFNLSAISEELAHLPTLMQLLYKLDRIAIVSDDDWVRTLSRLESALLPGVTYAVYDHDEAEAARAWVMEEAEAPHSGAFREIDLGKPGIVAYEISGRLDREESERGVAMVRARLEDPENTRLMLVIRNWHGFDLDRLLSGQVLSGKLEIARKLDRYAIVGGPKWVGRYAEFTGAFVKAQIKAFDLNEQDKALAWLEG